jgi:hypothetical protein
MTTANDSAVRRTLEAAGSNSSMRILVRPRCAPAHTAVSRAVVRNKAPNHLERDPPPGPRIHDELFDGRRLWILTVVNSYGTPPNGNGHQNLIAQPGTAVRSGSG